MRNFILAFFVCCSCIFASCAVIDAVTGSLVKPKQDRYHGMTLDEYATWYNAHAKENPGLIDPSKEPAAAKAPESAPVTMSDFEATGLAKTAEGAASAVPVPYLREGVEAAVYLSTLWTAWRMNRKKSNMVKALVESVDKEGSEKLENAITKTAVSLGVEPDLNKFVKKFKAAKKLLTG